MSTEKVQYKNRFIRQELIEGWDQKSLKNASVLVAGAGALSNEIIKNLALIGIGKILTIDFDTIEISNLSRAVFFREEQIGTSKAAAVAKAAKALAPELDIRYIQGDLFFDVGLGFYRNIDLVISGLDNIAARSKVARSCYYTNTPFIDGGIWAMGGELKSFYPGQGFCYDCTLSTTDWQKAHIRNSCTGFKPEEEEQQPAATNIATAAIIGGMIAQEVVRFFCNKSNLQHGEVTVYSGLPLQIHKADLPGEEACHCKLGKPLKPIISLDRCTSSITAKELLEIAKKYLKGNGRLELGRDLLIGFTPETCEQNPCLGDESFKPPFPLMNKREEVEKYCKQCKSARTPESLSYIEKDSAFSEYTLEDLSIPPGEVLAVMTEKEVAFFELTQDIKDFWK